MDQRMLRYGAFLTLAAAGGLWVGFAAVQSPWILLAGGVLFLIGFTGFVAVAIRDIYEAFASSDVIAGPSDRPRA